jgi:hypothetical protein
MYITARENPNFCSTIRKRFQLYLLLNSHTFIHANEIVNLMFVLTAAPN